MLREILEINPYNFPCGGLRCTVTITKLSPGQSWWFFSCNKCSRKSIPDGGSYRCSSYPCRGAKPRYKIIGTHGTTSTKFILFGEIRQQVVGKQVGTVLIAYSGGDDMPLNKAQIVCKKYTWHLNVTQKSFQGPKKSYQVNRIIVAIGRQAVVPRICALGYGMSSSSKAAAPSVQPEGSTSKTSDGSTAIGEHLLQILSRPASDRLLHRGGSSAAQQGAQDTGPKIHFSRPLRSDVVFCQCWMSFVYDLDFYPSFTYFATINQYSNTTSKTLYFGTTTDNASSKPHRCYRSTKKSTLYSLHHAPHITAVVFNIYINIFDMTPVLSYYQHQRTTGHDSFHSKEAFRHAVYFQTEHRREVLFQRENILYRQNSPADSLENKSHSSPMQTVPNDTAPSVCVSEGRSDKKAKK